MRWGNNVFSSFIIYGSKASKENQNSLILLVFPEKFFTIEVSGRGKLELRSCLFIVCEAPTLAYLLEFIDNIILDTCSSITKVLWKTIFDGVHGFYPPHYDPILLEAEAVSSFSITMKTSVHEVWSSSSVVSLGRSPMDCHGKGHGPFKGSSNCSPERLLQAAWGYVPFRHTKTCSLLRMQAESSEE